jgi:hypothetical protein
MIAIYPVESESFLGEITAAIDKIWIDVGDDPPGELPPDRKASVDKLEGLSKELASCSISQLREGSNLEGKRFSKCVTSLVR